MNPNISEELQTMYRNILLQEHNIAYTSMVAAFSSAAAASTPTIQRSPLASNAASTSFSLDSDIPRKEIECDPEIILVKNLRENLKQLETNLNGLHGKKFGYREVIEMASARSAYPVSPNSVTTKRNRASMEQSFGSPASKMLKETLIPSNDEKENSAKKPLHAADSHCKESVSSCYRESKINNQTARNTEKIEKPDIDCDEAKTAGNDNEKLGQEPVVEIEKVNDYNLSKFRFERMRSIQRKKPKFNISNLDLTYHSSMARIFPGSEHRTEDQQIRRDKNTLAARISRTKNKAYEKILEKQSVEVTAENITMKRKIACLRVYADSLMKLNGNTSVSFNQMWESNLKDIVGSSE